MQQSWEAGFVSMPGSGRSRIPGRNAMIGCILGALLIICAASAYRPAIKYAVADPRSDAIRKFAYGDTRYLAVRGEHPSVILPENETLPADESLEFDRDVRLVAPESDLSTEAAQNAYLSRYNSTMMTMVRGPGFRRHARRPMPISRPLFAAEITLAVLPILLTFYLRYRLGPYRRDGTPWTDSLWQVLWRYMLPRTYVEAARPLLIMLWIDVAMVIPWLLLVITVFGNQPLK